MKSEVAAELKEIVASISVDRDLPPVDCAMAVWRQLGELGLTQIGIPESLWGSGGTLYDLLAVVEAVAARGLSAARAGCFITSKLMKYTTLRLGRPSQQPVFPSRLRPRRLCALRTSCWELLARRKIALSISTRPGCGRGGIRECVNSMLLPRSPGSTGPHQSRCRWRRRAAAHRCHGG
jgi:hypothetical protein